MPTKRFVIEISEKNLPLLREMIRNRSDTNVQTSADPIPRFLAQLIDEAIADYVDRKRHGRVGLIDI